MATQPDPLRCGGCRGDTFKLAHVRDVIGERVAGGHAFAGHIAVTCCGCGAVSEIRPQPAALRVEWARDNEKGVLCGGWPP